MKSSMAITKSAAFRFLLLLHLFLKVKMCVGFVDAASAVGAAGDSDINYDDDSDEWLGVAGGGEGTANRVAWSVPSSSSSASASNIPPAPANLMRWEPGRDPPAAGRYRMHHVRHEQHYLKQRPAKVPNPSTESTLVAAAERDPYRAHTVTGADQQQQQKAQHNSHHHHHHHHQQQQHPRSHHAQHYKHHRKTGADGSEEEVGPIIGSSRSFSNERRHWFEQGSFKDAWNSMSGTGRDDRQVAAINRKRSASSFHSLSSNALPDASGSRSSHAVSSRDRTSKQSSQKSSSSSSISPGSKNYFEQLLNNYKKSSPYYKELHQASKTPQTKALPSSSRRNQRSSAEVTKSKASQQQQQQQQQQQGIDGDLDYLYDDETEESVQNDAPVSGGTMSTSTRAPASTTTTSTTTTTTTTTTTPRAILSASSDSDEASGGGSNDGSAADPSYSSYYQKAYAIHSNPRRNGNNRYNSLTRTAAASPTAVNHHSKRPHFDRIDPAKQVAYPGRYQSFTDYKQANFGTKDAVERSYSAYSNSQHERHQAKQHMERMIREGMCKVPRPRIVPASNDRTKLFTPQCTILHRCEDDTGCCGPTQTCAPKTTSEVQLYFYVQNVGQRQQNTIALTFSNHTECHCVQRSSSSSVRMQSHNLLEHSAEGSEGTGGSSSSSSSCTCPGPFKSVNDGTLPCYCDCLSSDQVCVRFKEGFESFSMETRKCIRSKRCTVPQCEYGLYNPHEGRCPKKSDRINEQFSLYR